MGYKGIEEYGTVGIFGLSNFQMGLAQLGPLINFEEEEKIYPANLPGFQAFDPGMFCHINQSFMIVNKDFVGLPNNFFLLSKIF